MPTLQIPEHPPKLWPRFTSPLHTPAVTARVGRILGIAFGICFVTGMLSHYQYHPWSWLPEPATPAWGYRVTQGLHVITGIASIPLLLIKLWTVYPNLFTWPPAKSFLHALERLSIAVFVSSALVEVFIGFFDVLDWYPWSWDFLQVHRYLGYVVIGSLLLHIAVKLPLIREGLNTPLQHTREESARPTGLSRRGLLVATAAGAGVVTVTTVGTAITPLDPIALLAPRRHQDGPLGVPVNRTAEQAKVRHAAHAASYRLTVMGRKHFDLDLAAIEALPTVERDISITCVEGWSVGARWRGPRLLDLVERAGGDANSTVTFRSLEKDGSFNESVMAGPQVGAALLATHLNGKRLPIDHGYPIRAIAPDRAGVLNTKWLREIEVR